jgi:hypothetical protein
MTDHEEQPEAADGEPEHVELGDLDAEGDTTVGGGFNAIGGMDTLKAAGSAGFYQERIANEGFLSSTSTPED